MNDRAVIHRQPQRLAQIGLGFRRTSKAQLQLSSDSISLRVRRRETYRLLRLDQRLVPSQRVGEDEGQLSPCPCVGWMGLDQPMRYVLAHIRSRAACPI